MAKSQAHTLVDAGSSPAAATKCRDGVTGNSSISKIDILGSNPSPCVLLRDLIEEAYKLGIQSSDWSRFDSYSLHQLGG